MKQKEASLKKGFTLAEVLITLGIIGVIAAITIPAVISSSNNEQYVTGVKKAYNTLKAIERETKLEHGDMENWTIGSDQKVSFDTYFRPYMDILKDCGLEGTGCFASAYTDLKGGNYTAGTENTYYKIVTSDGMAFSIQANTASKSYVYVDINGGKGPNRYGRDLFTFVFDTSTGLGIKPRGHEETSAVINQNCNTSSSGYTCAVKVLTEGQMKY